MACIDHTFKWRGTSDCGVGLFLGMIYLEISEMKKSRAWRPSRCDLYKPLGEFLALIVIEIIPKFHDPIPTIGLNPVVKVLKAGRFGP